MTAETQPKQNEYGLSIMSTIGPNTFLWSMGLPMEEFINIAPESGYEYWEWHSLLNRVGRQLLNQVEITQFIKNRIGSLHQSWRQEKTLIEALRHKRPMDAIPAYFLLPEIDKSIADLHKVQELLGKKLPIVLYPRKGKPNNGLDQDFSLKTYQPMPEVLKAFDVDTVEEELRIEKMLEKGQELGYDGITLDLTHMRENEDGVFLGNDILAQLLSSTRQIHLSAGRVDRRIYVNFDPMEELFDLYRGYGQSELIKMLQHIQGSGWKGRIVTEIPASALHQLGDRNGFLESPESFIRKHRRILGNVQDILG